MGKINKIRNVTVNGKKYKIKWQAPEDSYFLNYKNKRKYIPTLGLCDWEEKTIYINPNQSEIEVFRTILHELAHAYNPKWSEKKVERFERELDKLFKKIGIKF